MFEEEGFSVVVEKRLMQSLGGVRIDFESNPWLGARFSVIPLNRSGAPSC